MSFLDFSRECLSVIELTDSHVSLAYVEMRLLTALVLWNFDMELLPESQDWINHDVYLLWEKPQLMVNVKPRVMA